MSEREASAPPPEHDPSAELGLRNPVRDQERLGDRKYSVTPPREAVRAPQESVAGKTTCPTCSAELDPVDAYRVDAEEYVFHFCGAECFERWRRQQEGGKGAP